MTTMAIDNKDKKVLNVPHLRFPEFSGEWKRVELKDVAEFQKSRIPADSLDASCYISTENLIPNFGGIKEASSIPTDGNVMAIKPNDILISNIRPYLKKVWQSDRFGGCSADVFVLRTTRCQSDFLYNIIASDKFINYAMSGAKGVKMPRGDKRQMEEFEFSIPAIEEQNRISRLLSLLDERIATQNKIIKDLKKLKSAIVEMLLCNRNSELLKLGDIGYFVRGLTYANEDVTENKAATAVIRANNLNYGNHVDKGEVVYVSRTPATSQILRKGDIVICMANGSSALVGKNSYYPFNDGQSTVGAFCGIYRTSHPLAKWLMQSRRYKRLVYQSLQGGNGAIANLNGDDILNMSFPLIEKEKSQSIIFTIEAIEKSLVANKCLHRLYYTQKSYLLKQMFI